MSGLQLIPSPDLGAVATFETLGTNFKIDETVIKYLLKVGLECLEEFRFFWDAEEKIDAWLAKVGLKEEDRNLQGARLRRAWAAVRLWYTQAEQDRSKVATSDLDLHASREGAAKPPFGSDIGFVFPLICTRRTLPCLV